MDGLANAVVDKDTMRSTAEQRIQEIQRDVILAGTLGKFPQRDRERTLNLKKTLSRSSLVETVFTMKNALQI